MIAVSDANILILFARTGYFHLLSEIFNSIFISPLVYQEVVVAGNGRPGIEEIRMVQTIEVQSIQLPDYFDDIEHFSLGQADASVILLAMEKQPDFLLSDDRRVRGVAQALRMPIMGSGGLLIVAKAKRLITSVRPVLEQFKQNGARIGDRTFQDILRAANES